MKSCIQNLVDRLPGLLIRLDETESTTIGECARHFGVSYSSMRSAVRILRDRGIVRTRPRKGISLARHSRSEPPHPTLSAAEEFARMIGTRISHGEYRVGTPLPKALHFVITERCSASTVIQGLQRAARRQLIHKKGKQWIAGPAESRRHPMIRTSEKPVVVLVVSSVNVWMRICQNSIFVAPFFRSMISELKGFGFEIVIGLIREQKSVPLPHLCGQDAISRFIRDRESLFAGIMLYLVPEHADRVPWEQWARLFKRPHATCLGSTPRAQDMKHFEQTPGTLYFIANEEIAVSCAFDALVRAGHRRIGIPETVLPPGREFVRRRIALVQECAATHADKGIRIFHTEQNESRLFDPWRLPWIEPGVSVPALTYSTADPPDTPGILSGSRQRSEVIDASPSLKHLVMDARITALMAANDMLAMGYAHWLNIAGIRMPQDLSLISFDNREEVAAYRLSSIDFGLSDLGYRAAHLFIGDIPISEKKKGRLIFSTPSLVDRGSLGAPRAHRLHL